MRLLPGSEVQLLLKAKQKLTEQNIATRVVSIPSWELFENQDKAYKEMIFPVSLRKRLAAEAGSPLGWLKYVTCEGDVIAINRYGESAPGEEMMEEYGFTAENVVKRAKALIHNVAVHTL